MAFYRVYATYTQHVRVEVEADSKEEAEKIAEELNAGSFEHYDPMCDDNWQFDFDMTEKICD